MDSRHSTRYYWLESKIMLRGSVRRLAVQSPSITGQWQQKQLCYLNIHGFEGAEPMGKSRNNLPKGIIVTSVDEVKKATPDNFPQENEQMVDSAMISSSTDPVPGNLGKRRWNPLPIPHGSIPEPYGQDLDFVNVAHSHLIHSDWAKLDKLAQSLNAFRIKHVLLRVQKDYVLSLEFYKWVQKKQAHLHTLETHSMILHILTKNFKFKSAEVILKDVFGSAEPDLSSRLFEAVLYSYRVCDSSPRVFDLLFKTSAHMKKFRCATDVFNRMKDYGFLPTIL